MITPYIDTHLDTMWQSSKTGRKFSEASTEGHVDLNRARKGGLFVGFFTGFPTDDKPVTEKMMRDWIEYYLRDKNSHVFQIKNLKDLQQHENEFLNTSPSGRKIGAVLHFEGAAGIDENLNNLFIYHAVGLRSMSLTWNETNHFATGAKNESDRGLTELGFDLLSAMEDLGIMVDVSHLNDKSFWDVQGATNKPIFASHSNLRTPASSHKRNLEPEMVRAIADSGGSIGINFCNGFLRDDEKTNQLTIIGMFQQLYDMVGAGHIHIGSDMDGCTLPSDVIDVCSIPELLVNLQTKLDLSKSELEKIARKNIMGLMETYWYQL